MLKSLKLPKQRLKMRYILIGRLIQVEGLYVPCIIWQRNTLVSALHMCVAETPIFYQNYLDMRSTADVTGGKPIAA
jgi:hypothetical protein